MTIGSVGTGNDQFTNPTGFVCDDKSIYVCDKGNNRIVKRSLFGGGYEAKATGLSGPQGITLVNGNIFVCDTGNHKLKVYRKRDLKLLKTIGSLGSGNSEFNTPASITTDNEFIYIADTGNNRIVKYKIDGLEFNSKAGTVGSGNEQITGSGVKQIHFDRHENCIYIVDSSAQRVLKWRSDFSRRKIFMDKIVASDSTDSSLAGISGVSSSKHYVYILEASRVQIFDSSTLTTKATAGTYGTGSGNISDGENVAAFDDFIIISDSGNDKILIWNNYDPVRALSSRDAMPVFGELFTNPNVPIGSTQQGNDITIGGSKNRDKLRWIEEESKSSRLRWTEES